MNNSKIVIDEPQEEEVDVSPMLREQLSSLEKIVKAIEGVRQTKDWRILEDELLKGVEEVLMRRLQLEANKREIDNPEVYRLQGQLAWAKKYANLEKLAKTFKVEISRIKNQLK